MLQVANTDLFNPLVPKAHNCECQNLLVPLQTKPEKVNLKLNWRIFIFCAFGTDGLGSYLQSWALSVFFNFFDNKKLFFAVFIKLI